MPDNDYVELDAIRLSARGAAEIDGGRATIFVPRAEITRIEIVRGSGAERPLVAAILGFALLAIAAAPLVIFINAWRSNILFDSKIVAAAAFVVPALWLLDLAFRPRWMIVVHTQRDRRKLVFRNTKDRTAIDMFFNDARQRFRYSG
jgi:hypothetical protein